MPSRTGTTRVSALHGGADVLVIASERVIHAVTQALGTHVGMAESVFDALGAMMLGERSATPGAILVSSEQLQHSAEAMVRMLREVAPSARIIGVVTMRNGSAQPAPHPLARLVDALLFEPVSEEELRKAVGESLAPIASAGDGRPMTTREVAKRAKPQAPVEASTSEPAQKVEPAKRAAPASPSSASERAPFEEPIGDTDLIDEIMFGPDALAERAILLVKQETGWTDVRLVQEAPQGETVWVEVALAGERFGALLAPEADPFELTAWARWLARWLALDRSYRQFRLLTYRDDLTGAWNRRFFDAFLTETLRRASERRRPITVMVFDLDSFKQFNDRFGHEAGDDILRETVKLLNSVIRKGDRVCRIGGDEFAVIFSDFEGPRTHGSQHPESVEEIASRFQDQVCQLKFPKLGKDAPGTLSISAGLATYPWDGSNPRDLLRKADELALESKRRGKNVITFGPGAAEVCRRKPAT